MDTIKYLERALSNDTGRYNLTSIYRDRDCMVATDGHRMHIINNLSPIDTPHFMNKMDADFVNYNCVVPKSQRLLAEIKLDKKQLKRLKDYVALTNKEAVSTMTISSQGLVLTYKSAQVSASILIELREHHENLSEIGVRASYLYDALVSDTFLSISQSTDRDKIEYAPLVIESTIYSSKAIIMPCLLK